MSNEIQPRLSLEARKVLYDLFPGGSGFEWGSGGSTIWFAQRSDLLISVEHDNFWYDWVERKLDEGECSGSIDLDTSISRYHIPIDQGCPSGHGGRSSKRECLYMGYVGGWACFQSYVNTINRYPNDWFDYILVDGRARSGCLHMALPKLKSGGLLILDNSEREKYQQAIQMVNGFGWDKEVVVDGKVDGIYCQTMFWIKPIRRVEE